jgi:hypothetical protein
LIEVLIYIDIWLAWVLLIPRKKWHLVLDDFWGFWALAFYPSPVGRIALN